MQVGDGGLPEFHPLTVLRDWGNADAFRISDALTGVAVFGATGSGKTSGPATHIAYGYLAAGFGGLVLCAKKEERHQWERWAAETSRMDDLVIVDASGKWRFNFLDHEASRPGQGGGLTINIVAILAEIAGAVAGGSGKPDGGRDKFWEDSLRQMLTNLVDLAIFGGLRVSLPLLRSIVTSAPQNLQQLEDEQWRENSVCARTLKEADEATVKADPDLRADFEETQTYWLREYPSLSEKTRSIIDLTCSILIRPFVTRPLRTLFCTDTNIKPEDTFSGKILIIDLPLQEYSMVGRVASLAWKFCFQTAVLRRTQPADRKSFLRPVFLWADEAQNFVTHFDAEYVAVARSAGGATVFLTQNRESYRRVLGNYDAVDSLLGNLNCKMFCQNSSTETNDWAAKLLGERWLQVTGTSFNQQRSDGAGSGSGNHSSGVNRSEHPRRFVEPSQFTTLRRGGEANDFKVDAVVYNGGHLFAAGQEVLPYRLLTFDQR